MIIVSVPGFETPSSISSALGHGFTSADAYRYSDARSQATEGTIDAAGRSFLADSTLTTRVTHIDRITRAMYRS